MLSKKEITKVAKSLRRLADNLEDKDETVRMLDTIPFERYEDRYRQYRRIDHRTAMIRKDIRTIDEFINTFAPRAVHLKAVHAMVKDDCNNK